MSIEPIEKINNILKQLEGVRSGTTTSDIKLGYERLRRWKERSVATISKIISPSEGDRLENKTKSSFVMGNPMRNFLDECEMYKSHITALREEIENNPEFIIGNNIESNNDDIQHISYSPLQNVEKICNKFHIIARQLRNRHEKRNTLEVEDEYDVQDLIHALLKLEIDDIRPEEWTPSYAGKSARMDFLLKKERVVIEVKKTRSTLTEKEIGDQLLIDIARYKEYQDCKTLICFVYDPEGRIGNPVGLIDDLEKNTSEKLNVKVIIKPLN